MKLPKKVRVNRTEYYVSSHRAPAKRDLGMVQYGNKAILIYDTGPDGRQRSQATIDETFWHELTHAILWETGEHKLARSEEFVVKFSKALHEAISTARF